MPNQIRDISVIDKDTYPYIFEQNVTVKLRSNTGLVRLNVYRPKKSEGVPVIITYGPYGKDTPYEECRHGGILTAPFLKFWFNRQVKSNQYGLANRSKNQRGLDTIKGDLSKEELKGNCRDQLINNSNNFFRDDEYYASRDYNLEDIEVPLLSFGNLGNIVVHLRVPIAVRKSPFKHDTIDAASGRAIQFRAEKEWPLARTTYTKYFLTPDLDFTPDEQQCQIHKRLSYPALTVPDDNSYHRFMTKPFDHDVEITGHIVAPVNVSVTPELTGGAPKDIDVFVTVRHWAKDGSEIFYTGSIGDPVFVSKGWQRVSLRKINKDHPNHREYRPWRDSFSPDVQPVIPGEIYGVDIEIWPTQLVLQSGEKLSFEVSGGDTQGVGIFSHESPERSPERFGDINHLHFGPRYSNYVVLPIIPTAPS
ncbi:galactose-binding like protein, partial [Aureobasidium sp. EXF-3399]